MATKFFSKTSPGLACLLAWFLCLGASASASAQATNNTSIIFQAYTNAFYRVSSGQDTYFQTEQTGGGYTTFWEETEEIECVIDAYEWTTNAAYKAIITNLLNGFTYEHGTDWPASDDYNDDCLWSVMDFARGGMDTGMTNFCNIARSNFTNVFNRAWSTNDGGGLWWKYPDNDQKNACVNGPGAIAAYLLYQIYGDTNFWEESSNIFFWELSHLDNGSGKIWDHVSITNGVVSTNTVATTYNQGTFIGAANFFGQISDATAAANYTKNSMGSGGILPEYGIENNNSGFNAIFFRWMMRFMKDNGLQNTYQSWLQQNANAAWNYRRTSDNLSWCQWLEQTPATNLYSWDCISSLEAIDAMPVALIPVAPTLPPQVMLVSGSSYTYSTGVEGPGIGYQWYQGTAPVARQTNATFTVTAGPVGSSTNYYVVITNDFGAVTSSVSTVTSVAPLTTPYSTNLLQLNPSGYWPMHEAEAPAPGDIETNYGTLGLLGTAYYPDWAGSTVGIIRGVPGALANDSDTAVNFTAGKSTSAGTYTDCLFVPHASPLSTLIPPFSVECWFYPTNTTSEDIWAQCGDEGLNAGASGNGGGAVAGVRLVWQNGSNTGFQIFNLDGTQYSAGFAGDTNGTQAYPGNQWYHLVLTCDTNTNFSLYIDGTNAPLQNLVTGNGPGTYTPDYWSPLTIGGGRGGTRAVAGYIDEFAVYTNVITDIAQHYSDGIGESQAGIYVADVMNDHPVIYLRMDAPAAYSAPAVGAWPILMNYGSAGGSGYYTPGAAPGILAGPVNSTGAPYGEVTNNTALLSGISSFADSGDAPTFNPTGSNANFTVMAIFRGDPCDGRVQSIVGHGTNSWQLTMTTNGCLVFNAGNGNQAAGGTGQSAGDLMTAGVYNDGNWHQVVAVNQTNFISIYVDGVLDTSGTPNAITTTSVIPGNTSDVMIGSDPTYTNNPAGVGRSFAGQICEVAFFTNALTSAQVQGIYMSASTPLPEMLTLKNASNGQMQLNWSYGTLQVATNVCGPYLDVANISSPYTVTTTNEQQFYRLREN
ncbi:MAG TPA: LamG-like jellyroll fold domain-containing protein [Candidatus Sulfotelmatobacter sp.]|nr:LamG-like jellyroll fold domain-containing protein [Candidatus Sulfotelmatobacter sp.]